MFNMAEWANNEIEKFDNQVIANKLVQGAGQKVVYTPWMGEAGHQFIYHTRLVHFSPAVEKVVCIQRGMEALYPTATSFDYDWQDIVLNAERAGTDRWHREWPEIQARYPNHLMLQSGGTSMSQEWITINPEIKIPLNPKRRGLKVDVVLTNRNDRNEAKNWKGMEEVAKALITVGYTFAIIGKRPGTAPLDGMQFLSGDMDIDAGIEAIQNAKLFIGSDSGCCHLAALVGVPMIVQSIPRLIVGGPKSRDFVVLMKRINIGHETIQIPEDEWFNPSALIEVALEFLHKLKMQEPEVEAPVVVKKKSHKKKVAVME